MYRFVVCLSLAAAGFAAADEWQLRMAEGQRFRHAGRHAEAAESFRQAVKLTERSSPGSARLASALNSLALEYDNLARYPDAEANYRRALSVLEQAAGQGKVDYARTLANLGALYARIGRVAHGEKMMAQAIVLFDSFGPGSVEAATSRNMLAQSMLRAQRLDEAETLLQQAQAALATKPIPDSGWLAGVLNNLGMLRRLQGRHQEAILLMQQAMARIEAEFGPEHPLTARALNNVAAEYLTAGRREEADAAYRRSAALAESTLGPDHPMLGNVLGNYAQYLRDTGRKAESKRLAVRARDILRQSARRNGEGMTVDASDLAGR
jgi:tetratricopeptide (TPR) repeat protein